MINKINKKLLLFLLTSFSFALFAQNTKENIAIFVYSEKPLNEATNALRSRLESVLKSSVNGQYEVVDRTYEIENVLKKELQYQGSGLVSDENLVEVGKQLGASKICTAVITDYGQLEGYFIECKIIDIKKRTIIKEAEYPRTDKKEKYIHDIGIASSQIIANSLSEQLNLLSKEQKDILAKEQAANEKRQREFARKAYNRQKFHDLITSPGGSLLCSAVIPGLGLYNKGYKGWGVTIFLAEAGFFAGTIITYNNAQKIFNSGRSLSRDDIEKYADIRSRNIVYFVGTCVMSGINLLTAITAEDHSRFALNYSGIEFDDKYVPTLSLTLNF